ncbi:MAG: hypothetical protein R3A48_24340 [Polyangiales bacterium]
MAAHDTLAKDVLELLLDELGTFVREREVPAPASQRADSYFAPHAHALPALRALGLLGRCALRPCVRVGFYDAPARGGARVAAQAAQPPARREDRTRPSGCGYSCAGRPDTALRQFGFTPAAEWPRASTR